MPDKLTDSEIVKALDICSKSTNGCSHSKYSCEDCYLNGQPMCSAVLFQDTIDLINRLRADVENYKQIAEHQQSVTMDRGFEIKRLKEKIESLQAENERLREKVKRWKENYESSQVVVGDFREIINEKCEEIKLTKASAYKECIEKVKEIMRKYCGEITEDDLDNLLKKMDGEDSESKA